MSATTRDQFFAALHSAHLKQLGFRKKHHTFVRQHEGYAEHYQLQGSDWNDEAQDWRFYINCGISFDGVPRRSPDRDFPMTHAWARAAHLVAGARAHYDVPTHDPVLIVPDIVAVVEACAAYFTRRHAFLRGAYDRRDFKWPFLNDPELESLR